MGQGPLGEYSEAEGTGWYCSVGRARISPTTLIAEVAKQNPATGFTLKFETEPSAVLRPLDARPPEQPLALDFMEIRPTGTTTQMAGQYRYQLQPVQTSRPMYCQTLEDDPEILRAEARLLLRGLRRTLNAQALGGKAMMDFETKEYTPAGNDLIGLAGALTPGRAKEHATVSANIVASEVNDITSWNTLPNLIIAGTEAWSELWKDPSAIREPGILLVDGLQAIRATPELPPPCVVAGDFAMYHWLAVSREMRVLLKVRDQEATLTAQIQAAACIADPNAFVVITNP